MSFFGLWLFVIIFILYFWWSVRQLYPFDSQNGIVGINFANNLRNTIASQIIILELNFTEVFIEYFCLRTSLL